VRRAKIGVGKGGEPAVLPNPADVEAGAEVLVTRRGRPVARIVPAQRSRERQLTPEQEAALERTRRRLEKGWDLGGGKFNRDELYDD
jgi:hypothetical protein